MTACEPHCVPCVRIWVETVRMSAPHLEAVWSVTMKRVAFDSALPPTGRFNERWPCAESEVEPYVPATTFAPPPSVRSVAAFSKPPSPIRKY